MSQATFGIAITADDKTAKGARSAEKQLGQIPKHVSQVNKRYANESDRELTRSKRGILRTFGEVERAGAKVFGGRSMTAGITQRLSAVQEAASAAGTGLGEAATAGGVLEGTLGTLGVAAGATVGILAAAGYAAFKMADGWAKGAASIGRMAETIGVASKALQEFNSAGERAGVDKGASTGALGSIAQTLNDARYGRNNDALAMMQRLGIKMRNGADGQLDTMGMTMDLADKLSQIKNAQTRRMVASKFGISDAALPMFVQGSGQIRSDMTDAGKYADVLDDKAIAKGRRIARKSAIAGQIANRGIMKAGEMTADAAEPGYDLAIKAGRGIVDGATSFGSVVTSTFKPAVDKFERGVTKIVGALTNAIVPAAQAAERKYGVPASVTLGQYGLESGWGKHMPRGSNNPFGIKAKPGEPFVLARTREEDRHGNSYYTMAKFRKFNSIGEAFDAHARLLSSRRYAHARAKLPSVDAYADALTGVYATDHRYGAKLRSTIHGNNLTRFDQGHGNPIPVKVEIEMKGAPHGTKAKVTAGNGRSAAVSHARVGHD